MVRTWPLIVFLVLSFPLVCCTSLTTTSALFDRLFMCTGSPITCSPLVKYVKLTRLATDISWMWGSYSSSVSLAARCLCYFPWQSLVLRNTLNPYAVNTPSASSKKSSPCSQALALRSDSFRRTFSLPSLADMASARQMAQQSAAAAAHCEYAVK